MPRNTSLKTYDDLLADVVELLEQARRTSVRSVNTVMTATYWEVGRRIVEYEQGGKKRAEYGVALLKRLSADLAGRFGRGFSERNLEQMRLFYLGWPISQTAPAKSQALPIPHWQDKKIADTVCGLFLVNQAISTPLVPLCPSALSRKTGGSGLL